MELRDMKAYTLNITPQATPRPRFSRWGAYNTPKYTEYKKALEVLLKGLEIPNKDYYQLSTTMFFPYPKSTPKKNRLEGGLHRNRLDCDNIVKGLQDAMQNCGVLINDSQISDLIVRKRWTTKSEGYIIFELI